MVAHTLSHLSRRRIDDDIVHPLTLLTLCVQMPDYMYTSSGDDVKSIKPWQSCLALL
jgi:hypothetical protein